MPAGKLKKKNQQALNLHDLQSHDRQSTCIYYITNLYIACAVQRFH